MATTFSIIYQDPMLLLGHSTSDTTLATYVKRWANRRYKRICAAYKWPFLKDVGVITTLAEYTTGTVATDGTTGITGTSTVWTQAMTGRKFKTDAFNEIYTIAQYSSGIGIVLDKAFNGDDETTGTYSIFQPSHLCDISWADILSIRQYRTPRKLRRISLNEYRSRYPDAEPQNADPLYYALNEIKNVTRINIDTVSTKLDLNEIVSGGTSTAYGVIVGSYTDYLYVQILYGTFVDGETLTDQSSHTATVDETDGYTEGNVGGMLNLLFWPVPYRAIRLDCDVILKAWDMSADDDEPLIPEDYRDAIIYGACADLAAYDTKQADQAKYEALYRERINQMAGELIPSTEQFVQIIPDNIRKRYGGVGAHLILDRKDY